VSVSMCYAGGGGREQEEWFGSWVMGRQLKGPNPERGKGRKNARYLWERDLVNDTKLKLWGG